MKRLVLAVALSLTASTAFSAGDLIVTGKIGAGTTIPRATLDVIDRAIIPYIVESTGFIDLTKAINPTLTPAPSSVNQIFNGGPSYRGDSSYWRAATFPATITYDLGANTSQYIQYITFGCSWRDDVRRIPYSYKIEHSPDGAVWTQVASTTANTEKSIIHPVSIVSTRYIRLTVLAPQPGQTESIVSGFQTFSVINGAMARKEPWAVIGNNASIALTGNVGIGSSSPGQKLEVAGGVRLNTIAAKPACTDAVRGTVWFSRGATGVKDTIEVCAKDAAGTSVWRMLW